MFSRSAIATTFANAKNGSILNQIYEKRITETSFSSYSDYKDTFYDFLQKEPNSAFYTSPNWILDDIFCKVCNAMIVFFEYRNFYIRGRPLIEAALK